MYWRRRDELSLSDRLRRSYYILLRDELDQYLIDKALTESYGNFVSKNIPYPFVELKELKPRARSPKIEYEHQNSFLVMFIEDTIPESYKKYIRFFDSNKTTVTNLSRTKAFPVEPTFDRTQKYLDSVHFFDYLNGLLPMDYALLIQREPKIQEGVNRYSISHFHVRVDWPITEAAEDLGRMLRYISKDLYEKGDKYAEDLQKKFFEYYCLQDMVGGRRTAAIVAAQYLRRIPCLSTIYVASTESRSLIQLTERGVSKVVLVKLNDKEVSSLAEANAMSVIELNKNYRIAKQGRSGVFLFQTRYAYSSHALPPEDGKLRDLKPETYWLSVELQQILPKAKVWSHPPLKCNLIYTQ
ncbi:MAG: hypothetical protein MUE70_11845 [Desulfobacterales bacterium]|nr:hypothetical protein [Desulfobacterales bacterium]